MEFALLMACCVRTRFAFSSLIWSISGGMFQSDGNNSTQLIRVMKLVANNQLLSGYN